MVILNRGGDSGIPATILSGQTDSSVIDGKSSAMFGVAIPASFTGTALSFKVCNTQNGTYQALTDRYGVAVSMVVAQGKSYTLPNEIAPWPYFRVVSGSSEGADRIVQIVRKH